MEHSGIRILAAIRVGAVEMSTLANVMGIKTLNREEVEALGWFNGPPDAVAELVFDEDDFEACSLEPDEAG